MNRFRIKPHEPQRSMDGFIPNTGSINGENRPDSWESQNNPGGEGIGFDDSRPQTDGFHPAGNSRTEMGERLKSLPDLPKRHRKEKKEKKRRLPSKKALKRTVLAIVLMGLLFGGYFFGKAWWTTNKVLKGGGDGAIALNSEVDPTLLQGEGDGRVNILMLGKGGENHPGGELTDSILVASIDPIGKEASLLSVPRDLWVTVPDYYSMKINAVYTTGKQRALNANERDKAAAEKAGISLLENVLEDSLGIPIHYYVMVNFEAFKQGVDAVGGVTIDVQEPLYDYLQAWDNGNNPLIAAAGKQKFNGKKALLYARSRSTSSDFARGERQREVAVALKDKVLGLGTFSNPVAVSKLIDAVGDNVTTSLSLSEIMRLYELSKEIPSSSIASLGFTDEPNVLVTTGNIGGQSVVMPRRGVSDFSEIQSFVRNSLRDGFLKSENANVAVLNGSGTPGAATEKAEELMSYGYNVVFIGDAPDPSSQTTQLIDFSGGVKKYTRRYLEQRLNVGALSSLEGISPGNYNADFVVIVGSR